MPPHSELPGELKRRKLIKALRRLGFLIDERGGDGSHYKTTWPPTQKSVTIPQKLPKEVLSYVLKEIERYSGVTWDDIRRQL
ncbi:MAG: type II toxin-antitoxin system HicA family toxin [bacterium]|nr:type II toxin-antitoxin system HicA family toxin [bacterium]